MLPVVEIIGAPFDGCGKRAGSRLGPTALRLGGFIDELRGLGLEVLDAGDVIVDSLDDSGGGLRNFDPMLVCTRQLRAASGDALLRQSIPLVLGGDHSLAAGSISAALDKYGDSLGVMWIDAHADVHTPGSSMTGNMHGMPLAALCGLPSETEGKPDVQWNEWLAELGPNRLSTSRIAWYGLRDVDLAERRRLDGLPITMHDIDRRGIELTVRDVDRWLRKSALDYVWISLDVDVLDPILAPGTGTAVRGGLTYREAHLFAELMYETLQAEDCPYKLVGIDIVETNPLYDNMNETAGMAREWVASLFGKTILGLSK
jgi:arginase